MRIKKVLIMMVAALMLSLASCIHSAPPENCTVWDTTEQPDLKFRVETIQLDSGWGYAVYVDEKKLILQRQIPVVEGFHQFKTQCDAMHCGKLVVLKLIKGEMPPSITEQDLIDMNILKQ